MNHSANHRPRDVDRRAGVILLVVLSMLTFFSLMIAAYLVFSNQNQQTSFAIAARNTKQLDVSGLMDDGLMMLIRGTGDGSNPFFGQDLLSDFYGRKDAMQLTTNGAGSVVFDGSGNDTGFTSVPVGSVAAALDYDDIFAGRIITFRSGLLENRSYRVLRSLNVSSQNHQLIVQLGPDFVAADIPALPDSIDIWVNGVPRNSPGLGYDGTNVNAMTIKDMFGGASVGYDLPWVYQPNHLTVAVDRSAEFAAQQGDFDESYDAADFNNWFLSYRANDGTVIPSFHRPSLINYLVNLGGTDWSTQSGVTPYSPLMASIARATMRPLPTFADQFSNTLPINERFTGGNANFALRTPIEVDRAERLDQIVRVLAGAVPNAYDVDNDGDGVADSIWVDLGLPVFTAPDGKLVKPLIAPMIEDLGGRLNVSAHGTAEQNWYNPDLLSNGNDDDGDGLIDEANEADPLGFPTAGANWAGTLNPFGNPANANQVLTGIGYGPAEILLPNASDAGLITDVNSLLELRGMTNTRNQTRGSTVTTWDRPGRGDVTADSLDAIRTGFRPPTHLANGGYGHSMDPFGRSRVGVGRNGDLVAAKPSVTIEPDDAATTGENDPINEAVNDPYERDPRGQLSGDLSFSLADLEALLRSKDFDSDLLPQAVRDRFLNLITNHPEYARSLTTQSVSDDSPPSIDQTPGTLLGGLIDRLQAIGGVALTPAQIRELIAPELRLGRKLDVNRRFGNGVDDDGDGIVDEPTEVAAETESFAVAAGTGQTIPADFTGIVPDYNFDTVTTVTGRQLLARHLYVLMMLVVADGNDFPSVNIGAYPAAGDFDAAAYRAQRIAQWAVNVVDYRDPDSIMTGFDYDPNPFNGWDLAIDSDGDGTADQYVGAGAGTTPSPKVWGAEAPELMFSESAAFHDVRLRDTDVETPNPATDVAATTGDPTNPDPDSDQVRVPQGSLFLELYCPRAPVNGDQETKPGAPQELYVTNAAGVSQLDLARTAPPASGTAPMPVWRIAITEPHFAGTANENSNPAVLRNLLPDSASFEQPAYDELNLTLSTPPVPPPGPLDFERFIWFTNYTTRAEIAQVISDNLIADMNADEVFFPPATDIRESVAINTDRLLEPGQYLVIAPREVTHLGSREYPTGSFPGTPSQQRFVVDFTPATGGLIQYERGQSGSINGLPAHDGGGMRTTPTMGGGLNYTAAMPLIVATFPPIGWSVTAFEDGYVGLNVSEPLPTSYYTRPEDGTGNPLFRSYNGTVDNDGVSGVDYPLEDAYLDFTDPTTHPALDEPEDVATGILPTDASGEEPLLGTLNQFCSAYLQRLADPTRPYHPATNPYRTVDWIPIDLTVFSGEDEESSINRGGPAADYAASSRQRNGFLHTRDSAGTSTRVRANSLFSYETTIPPTDTVDAGADDYFALAANSNVATSLSFLNTETLGNLNRVDEFNAYDTRMGRSNPGFVGFTRSIGADGITPADLTGTSPTINTNDRNLPVRDTTTDPAAPFAMHPWLNRPFASHFELLMVPASSQGRLFEEFTFHNAGGDPDIYPNTAMPDDPVVFNGPFRHLLNFFNSSFDPADGAQFARLLDYVHTLPRFQGEVEAISPTRVIGTPLDPLFAPPFNFSPDNRRQGTINLNSIAEFPVWAGLMKRHMNLGEQQAAGGFGANQTQFSFDVFRLNRRGYLLSGTNQPVTGPPPYNYDGNRFDAKYPTQFAGVFRNVTDTPFAPELGSVADTDLFRRRGVNGSLLRGAGTLQVNDPVGGPPTATSLFVRQSDQDPGPAINRSLYRDRNPFLRYQSLMRMPNLVSDNSQLFVIRLTMGFFEVDANELNNLGTGDRARVNLGAELGAANSTNQRYQAMFIVDRSIPVGFVPGQDLNARDIVVFERFFP